MFASIKKSCTFVLGLSKEVLSPINLLVISFSVINYVVRVRVHARCVDAHFFCIYIPSSDMYGRFDRLSDQCIPVTELVEVTDYS